MPKAKELSLVADNTAPEILPMRWVRVPRKFKIVRAPTLDRLELLVNEFISQPENSQYAIVGAPMRLANEEYVLAFEQIDHQVLA